MPCSSIQQHCYSHPQTGARRQRPWELWGQPSSSQPCWSQQPTAATYGQGLREWGVGDGSKRAQVEETAWTGTEPGCRPLRVLPCCSMGGAPSWRTRPFWLWLARSCPAGRQARGGWGVHSGQGEAQVCHEREAGPHATLLRSKAPKQARAHTQPATQQSTRPSTRARSPCCAACTQARAHTLLNRVPRKPPPSSGSGLAAGLSFLVGEDAGSFCRRQRVVRAGG